MKPLTRCTLCFAVALLFGCAFSAVADTLEMRDGRVFTGRYLGGTQGQVRFEVDGRIELYPVERILALTFGGDTKVQRDDDAVRARPAEEKRDEVRRDDARREDSRREDVRSGRNYSERVTVPAGTRILVRMIDGVDSAKNHVGDKFRASLEENLLAGEVIVAPRGTDVYGRLVEAKDAGHMTGRSELKLELTDISINGQLYPIMTGDYELAGKSRGENTAKKVGGGAVAGAIIGAIAGGGKGAAIGAGVGAGAGGAVQVFTKGEQVRVPSETMLEFRIEQPFSVVPAAAR